MSTNVQELTELLGDSTCNMTLNQRGEEALVAVTRAQRKRQLAAVKEAEEGEISSAQPHPLLPPEPSTEQADGERDL